MPIYAYRCSNCGHEQDVLQKMSDAPLTQCPACGQSTYAKQVTAAGFQLKGSGWYVTDFRNNGAKPGATAGKSADNKESATNNANDANVAKDANAATPAAATSSTSSNATPAASGSTATTTTST